MNTKENAEKAKFTMCLRLIMIGLLALSIIALFLFLSVSCDDEIEAKDIKFTIESESTKNIKYDRQTGEYTFYYGSEKGARLVIKASLVNPSESEKDFKDFTWTIYSSAYGKEYTPLQTNCFYMRDDDTNITQRFARFNNNIFTINLDYIDTLSTYTITASYKDKKAEFILNVDSQRIIASTDFSISYCALNVKEDGTVSKTTGTNITSNIPPNTTLSLTKGMAYEIGFRNSIKNPFGTFTYTIEENDNSDSGFFFIDDNSESLLTKSISTLASTPTVYIFVDSEKASEDTPILIKASAGDKKTQTFYVAGKTKRDHDINLDNLFSVNAFPVAGGYSVEFALADKNYKDKYAIAYSVDGAVDREIIYFDDTLKATFLYTNSDYPFDSPTQKTVSVKGKLISINDTRYGDIESADKECTFTVKKIPASGVMYNNNNNNMADHLMDGDKNLLRTTIKGKANYEKIGGFVEYADYIPVTLSISPRNFTTDSSHKIELALLKDAHFVIEHENEIIIDVPLVNETGGLNLEPYIFDIKTPNDGGTYKSYIKDIQGYTNTPLNEVSTVIISVVQIEGEVQFFQYRQTDSSHAIYKVRVLNTNIDSSKYKLFIEYSLNGGNAWSNLIPFDGDKVFTTDPNDLEQGQEIKVNGQSHPFETNSKNVLFRSLIIAKEETINNILVPTTGIYNETREYVSTADMATATPCTVSDKTQDYYNARQITITRPSSSSTAKYYIKQPDNKTGLTSKIEPTHPMDDVIFGQIRDTKGVLYGTTKSNTAILLLTENDVTLNRDNAIIVKTSEPGKDDSYFRYVFQLKKIASAPEVSTSWPKAWRDVWHEIRYIKDDLNNGYEYIICRAMMGEPYTDSRHILFNSGYSDTYWVSDYQGHTSQLQTSTSPRTRKEKYSATGEKGTFICYEVLLIIDYWNTYTQGYIAKKGMLRSDVAISSSSSEHKGEWYRHATRDVAPKTITKTRGHDLLLNKSFRYSGN